MMPDSEPSFDPRTWGLQPAPAPDAGAAAIAAPSTLAPAARSGERPRRWLAVGGAVLVLAGGALFAVLSRGGSGLEDGFGAAEVDLPAAGPAAPADAAPDGSLVRRSLVVAGVGGIAEALEAMGVDPAESASAAQATAGVLPADPGEIRLSANLTSDDTPRLAHLEALLADGSGASVRRAAQGFDARYMSARLSTRTEVVRGEMDSESFYSSAVTAGVTDTLIPNFAAAFAYDFDFQREINPGDVFEAAFEHKVDASGTTVGLPKLVYASLQTPEKSRALYHFAPTAGEPGWFDGNGRSIVRSLMRTPVDGARVSSRFGYRTHPTLGYRKLHRGIDFAAPTGTPIFAAGDGTVTFAAMKGANGNFVRIVHKDGMQTLYLHLNRFAPGIAAGVPIRQGQTIGEVGTTGRSTGPHLHYEIHINGEAVDPTTVRTEEGRILSGATLAAFEKERDRIDRLRVAGIR